MDTLYTTMIFLMGGLIIVTMISVVVGGFIGLYIPICSEDKKDEEDATMGNLTEENGHLIDYHTNWYAALKASPKTIKHGWRVFNKDGSFEGLLDDEKVAVWTVDATTLRQDTGYRTIDMQPEQDGRYLVKFYNSSMPEYDCIETAWRDFKDGEWIQPIYNYAGDGYQLVGWYENI